MKASTRFVLIASICVWTVAGAGQTTNMKPYPAAENGFERMVFRVPAVENESLRKVEIIVGKTMSVDCNRTSFSGDLDTRVAAGWGYPYFVVEKIAGPMSTRMACPPGAKSTEAFVAATGDGFLQRYNSKLPMVVYVPDGFEVRYRVWVGQEAIGRAEHE